MISCIHGISVPISTSESREREGNRLTYNTGRGPDTPLSKLQYRHFPSFSHPSPFSPGDGGINGQEHRTKPTLHDFVQHGLACLSIAVYVKLEEEWLVCRPGSHDFLDGARRIVRDDWDDPLRRARTQNVFLLT